LEPGDGASDDPPTAANFLDLQSKLNELIVALRR